ncbi:hypothetical protein OIU79_020671 [Salix purpurea]|uniref:Uncharacterized protein n=1 Tax=Salix purpurea TaxID=77065 RepID=A0A9Q1AG17_SALPP|nr:hypothetical protein OIU79_020671 [Salix purpurea]
MSYVDQNTFFSFHIACLFFFYVLIYSSGVIWEKVFDFDGEII